MDDLIGGLLTNGMLPPRLREVVIMRVGWCTGSIYEWSRHWHVAVSVGLAPDEISDIRDWQVSDRFNEIERALLAATDEALATDRISDQNWQRCKEALGDDQLMMELVGVIGNWRMVALMLNSLQIALEDSDAPWPPDGVDPRAEQTTLSPASRA